MQARSSVFIAASLDGFIARENGGLDWLDDANATVPDGEDCGYSAFMASVDVMIMGRMTYEKVLTFGEWPYAETRVVVVSGSPISFPEKIPSTVSHSSESPTALHERLSKEGVKQLYIDGGITIQRFLAEGLIDEFTVTVIPIILGKGISLFGQSERKILLNHIETKSFEFGFVQSRYSVIK